MVGNNFSPGFRTDARRPLKAVPKVGTLIVRVRDDGRFLVKVLSCLEEKTGRFLGQYVNSAGEAVKPPKTFLFARWPLYAARKSH